MKTIVLENVRSWRAEGERMTVNYEEWMPKDGDFVKFSGVNSFIAIYKCKDNNVHTSYAYYCINTGVLSIHDSWFSGFGISKPSEGEIVTFHAALHNIDKRWNATEGRVENIGLERTRNKPYWRIEAEGVIRQTVDCGTMGDNQAFELGNYFHSQFEAKEFFEKEIEPIYKKRK